MNFVFLIRLLSDLLTLVVFLDVVVSYFLDPYHPVRRTLDAIVQPMLAPIKRILPPVGMFDFSPLVLLLLIQFVAAILIRWIA